MDNETQVNPPVKPRIEPSANASLVFGLLSFILIGGWPLFFALFAIFFGHAALKNISASKKTLAGRWRAICGLCIGYLWLAVIVFLIVSAIARSGIEGYRVGKTNDCQRNIKVIAMNCQKHALANHNQLPPDLETLQRNGLLESHCLFCPIQKDKTAKAPSYLYFGAGLKREDLDRKTILIVERDRVHQPHSKKPGFNIGFGDGHTELIRDAGDLATIARKNGWKLPGAEKP